MCINCTQPTQWQANPKVASALVIYLSKQLTKSFDACNKATTPAVPGPTDQNRTQQAPTSSARNGQPCPLRPPRRSQILEGDPIKTEVKIPYSADSFTVEAERIPALFDLPVVRVSVGERHVALTPDEAIKLGQALLEACSEQQ
ncbi:hypothetical protein AL755_13770 [Arthrobacter sp. ERGS1:01]|nr:hypothetical protein AL755_13770 [Arthrobacter sp. ERGS1:01]